MVHVIATSVNSYLPIYDSGWTFQVVFIYPSTSLLESCVRRNLKDLPGQHTCIRELNMP